MCAETQCIASLRIVTHCVSKSLRPCVSTHSFGLQKIRGEAIRFTCQKLRKRNLIWIFLNFGHMKKDIITQEMRNLMEVIREQHDHILSHEGKIPQIELDILMGNVRKLYENLYELARLNENPIKHNTPPAPPDRNIHTDELIAGLPSVNIESIATDAHPIESPSASRDMVEVSELHKEQNQKVAYEHIQPEVLTAQLDTPVEEPREEISNEAVLPQAALAKERSREFSKPSAKAQATATLFDEPTTMSPSAHTSTSLYEKITASKEDKSIATKLQKNPVSDLKKSIGINEKFSFINELFDGDLNAYNSAIEKLNGSNNLDEANAFLQNELIEKYNWNGESDSFLKLRDLLDRRFTA